MSRIQKDFSEIANDTMLAVLDALDQYDIDDILDASLDAEIIKINSPKGQFVLNKFNSFKQIWLVSPLTGPYRFNYQDGMWIDRNSTNLAVLLTNELSQFVKQIKFNL